MASVVDEFTAVEHHHAVEILCHGRVGQHPDDGRHAAVPVGFLEHVAQDLVLQPLVERAVFLGLLEERLAAVDVLLADGDQLASAPAGVLPPHLPPLIGLWQAQAATERAFRGEALDYAADHPLYPLRVVWWASVRMLNLADPELERLSVREAGAPDWLRAANRFAIWALALAAVAGVLVRRPPLWLWLTPVLLWLSVAVAIGATRYRTPVDPFLILLAAPALVRWRRA